MSGERELRCPVNHSRLFAKLLTVSGAPLKVVDGNLMEFACHDCLRALRKKNRPVVRVLHRFNLLGELVESVEIPPS